MTRRGSSSGGDVSILCGAIFGPEKVMGKCKDSTL